MNGYGPAYADVALPLALPGPLTYRVPEPLRGVLRPGLAVVVPLGSRRQSGHVIRLHDGPAPVEGLKDVLSVDDDAPSLPPDLLEFVLEAAAYYFAPPGEAIRSASPKAARRARRTGRSAAGAAEIPEGAAEAVEPDVPPDPTAAQRAAVGAITGAMAQGRYKGFLLHGVTGSGKTEVYLRCAAEALARERSCLVLVPEIALTPQLVGRFRARLGGAVEVIHSGVPPVRRRDAWERIRSGDARVVVGARSALFVPLRDPALIVVDEEHDHSFKQEDRFRYHGRDMAILRARRAGAVVVLGSATPSLESYRNARTGKLELLVLPDRVTPMPLPAVRTVDMRRRANRIEEWPFFSRTLAEEISAAAGRGEQAILFLNRRGFAPAAVCAGCGEAVSCPSCAVAMTYHKTRDALLCHWCGFSRKVPDRCGSCSGGEFDLVGLGTERVAAAVRSLFPDLRVARLDSDAAGGRKAEAVLDRFRGREIDVLVGTQMVTKGHDLPNVTLVGIVQADLGLHVPDFRAAERTFQLLTQVAGRAGRGDAPGLVVLQTMMPDHYAIAAAARQDYAVFIQAEAPFRRELGYPPFGSLALVRADGVREEAVAAAIAEAARAAAPPARECGVMVLGPCPAPLVRLRGRFRRQMLLRGPRRADVRRVAAHVVRWNASRPARSAVRIAIDVDPVNLM
ncbi:MAG: primosomal protein N' [Myxococcota bacterium]|nr:primosomal protein N' [Myxococcota bacterium]